MSDLSSESSREARFARWRKMVKPLPAKRAVLDFSRTYSRGEWARIREGLIPREMEDKWFIFLEEGVLRLVRSWTGFCTYEVHAVPADDGTWTIDSAVVNRDPDQYGGEDARYDAALLEFLIENLLLGKRRPFPLPSGHAPAPVAGTGLFQHHIAGTGYPEVEVPPEPGGRGVARDEDAGTGR